MSAPRIRWWLASVAHPCDHPRGAGTHATSVLHASGQATAQRKSGPKPARDQHRLRWQWCRARGWGQWSAKRI